MSFLLSSDGFATAVERAKELLSNSPLPIPLCPDLPEIERVYLLFLQGSSAIRAVHFGKVLRLIPFSLRSEDDKLKFVQHISISRAIHHDSIVAPVGCVKSESFPQEVRCLLWCTAKNDAYLHTEPKFVLRCILPTILIMPSRGKTFPPMRVCLGLNGQRL